MCVCARARSGAKDNLGDKEPVVCVRARVRACANSRVSGAEDDLDAQEGHAHDEDGLHRRLVEAHRRLCVCVCVRARE